jgi:hypothetical protein
VGFIVAKYRYEDLDDMSFQKLCQALLVSLNPELVSPPVRQKDGGHDAFSLSDSTGAKVFSAQVKWVTDIRGERDPVKWLEGILKNEEANLRKMAAAGTKDWLLITNVPSTSQPEVGRLDRFNKVLSAASKRLKIKLRIWWRDDLDKRLDSASLELKLSYPDMLVGFDAMRALLAESFKTERKKKLGDALRRAAAVEWSQDSDVRFKHGELDGVHISDLFVDVPIRALNRPASNGNLLEELDDESLRGATETLLGKMSSRNLMVLGAPGQGKSTLLQMVCQIQRAAMLGRPIPFEVDEKYSKPETPRLVFRVDLRDYALWIGGGDPFSVGPSTSRKRRRQISLEAFAAEKLSHENGSEVFSASDVSEIENWLPCLFALDGLDEVADSEIRKRVVQEIDALADRARENREETSIIVTARPSYSNAAEPSESNFLFFELAQLNVQIRNEYLAKWIHVQALDERDENEVRRIFKSRSRDSHVLELTTNPMQLAILLYLIYRRGDSIPDSRTYLYQNYMDLFLDRESIKDANVKRYRPLLERITAYLGWHLQSVAESDTGNGRATRSELVALIKHHLLDLEEDTTIVDVLFTAVTDRVWAMTSRISGTFEFEVQPIREYFAARHLFDTAPHAPKPGEGLDKFRRFAELIGRPYWLNVTRFMAGLFSDGESSAVIDLMEGFIEESDRPTWARTISRVLIEDGVFDSQRRARTRLIHAVYDPFGVATFGSTSEVASRTADLSHGADEVVAFLRTSMEETPTDRLNLRRAAIIGRYRTDITELYGWWEAQLSKLSADSSEWLLWLSALVPLGLVSQITDSSAASLLEELPAAARTLLAAGFSPAPSSAVDKAFTQLVLDGAEGRVRGTSFAADLFRVSEHDYLRSRDPSLRESLDLSAHSGLDLGHRDRSAPQRLGRSSSPGKQLMDALHIGKGRRGSTFVWSDLSNALVSFFGKNWLASRIAIAAAADPDLTLAYSTDGTATQPFGSGGNPSILLRDVRSHVDKPDWWEETYREIDNPTDVAVWTLGLVTASSTSVVMGWLDRLDGILSSLSNEWIEVIAKAIQSVSTPALERLMTEEEAKAIYAASPIATALLMRYLPAAAGRLFDVKGLGDLRGVQLLVDQVVADVWDALTSEVDVSDEVLPILTMGSIGLALPRRAIAFSREQAAYIHARPAEFAPTIIAEADEATMIPTPEPLPLAELAKKESWFTTDA